MYGEVFHEGVYALKLRDQPKWRWVSGVLLFITYLIVATFFLIDFINREPGMPLNPWYGFICGILLGSGLIGMSIGDYVTGYEKNKWFLLMSVCGGGLIIFFASLSFFVYS